MTDLRRNDDLDLFMGITPQTVTPNGPMSSPTPVPVERLQDHRPSRTVERLFNSQEHVVMKGDGYRAEALKPPSNPPRVGVLVSATAPKLAQPDHRAKVKATAIKLLYALRHLSPAERVEVLEAALKIERS